MTVHEHADDDLQVSAENEFRDFAADVVTDYEAALVRLFAYPAGQWVRLDELSDQIEDLPERLGDIEQMLDGPVVAAWLDYSQSDYGPGFCTIVFFAEAIMRTAVAVYNRHHLLDQQANHA